MSHSEEGLDVTPTPYSPLGIRVGGRPSLIGHPWLSDGRLEVQDEGSQLIGYLVAPRRNEMVVDFCAGAAAGAGAALPGTFAAVTGVAAGAVAVAAWAVAVWLSLLRLVAVAVLAEAVAV